MPAELGEVDNTHLSHDFTCRQGVRSNVANLGAGRASPARTGRPGDAGPAAGRYPGPPNDHPGGHRLSTARWDRAFPALSILFPPLSSGGEQRRRSGGGLGDDEPRPPRGPLGTPQSDPARRESLPGGPGRTAGTVLPAPAVPRRRTWRFSLSPESNLEGRAGPSSDEKTDGSTSHPNAHAAPVPQEPGSGPASGSGSSC